MKRGLAQLAVLVNLLFLASDRAAAQVPPASQPALDKLMDRLGVTRTFKEVALAPDGRRVAWVENLPAKEGEPTGNSAIFIADLGPVPQARRRITAQSGAACAEHGLAWSPDSARLIFLSDAQKRGQKQLYLTPVDKDEPRQLTDVKGALVGPRWAPSGKQIAVLLTPDATRPSSPIEAAAPEVGVLGEPGVAQRLFVVDVDSGSARWASPPGLHVFEFDWSGDSKHLAAVAAPPPSENNWYVARLYIMAADSGAAKELLNPRMQIAAPRWSPDGKTVAFIGGLMSDEGANGGDLFTVPAAGGKPRNITPGLKASATWLTWLPDSNRILFAEHVGGGSGLATVELDGGRITSLWTGPETIYAEGWVPAVSPARDGKSCALVRHSFGQPPEVWAGPLGDWRQVTHANKDTRPSWGQARSLHWQIDGLDVQGWLLYPRVFDPSRRYPMVVSVHGGPASSRRPGWPTSFFDLAVLADEGYFVFFPNPRGSFGQGSSFTKANVKDLGHGDLRDILAGVDEVLKVVPVDKNRLAIAGWSYGGFMTMWSVTQTQRFRAAIAGAGIANWQSYYGQNGIDQWLLPYFGATVYDDPAIYARSSPINFIKQARTPTLLLVGERDLECPAAQSREFWHALRTLKVPTQMVVFPGEGHVIADPRHRRDIMRRTAAWLERYLEDENKQVPSK